MTIYISDRGDKFDVAAMETSHLVNVIGHHYNQQATLQKMYEGPYPHPALRARIEMLDEVIWTLTNELIRRPASADEYLIPEHTPPSGGV